MSRFYGEVKGKANSKATREGTEASGIEAHIRGWDVGIKVECFVDHDSKQDVCQAWTTGGSKSPAKRRLLGTARHDLA